MSCVYPFSMLKLLYFSPILRILCFSLYLLSSMIVEASHYVYVANTGNDKVIQIDIATGQLTDVQENGMSFVGPAFIAITSNGQFAYVTNGNGSTVSVVNILQNTLISTIPGFNSPSGIAITPNGKYAYTANHGNSTVSRIDIATSQVSTVADPFSLLNHPIYIAITPNGKYAYVSNFGASANGTTVSVIDLLQNTVISTISGFFGPYGIAITPNGKYVYVASRNDSVVDRIDIATGQVSTVQDPSSLLNFPIGIAITPNGKYAYVTNFGSSSNGTTVSVIDLSQNTVISSISGFDIPFGIAITPGGTSAYVTNNGNSTVSVLDIARNAIISSLPGFSAPMGVAITPQSLAKDTSHTFYKQITPNKPGGRLF